LEIPLPTLIDFLIDFSAEAESAMSVTFPATMHAEIKTPVIRFITTTPRV